MFSLVVICVMGNRCAGGDSGAVHNTVRARWEAKDPELVEGMKTLGHYADLAVICLCDRRYADLAALMEQNFAMRLKLYGEAVVGAKNLEMVEQHPVLPRRLLETTHHRRRHDGGDVARRCFGQVCLFEFPGTRRWRDKGWACSGQAAHFTEVT